MRSFLPNIALNSIPTLLPKMFPRSVLKNASLDPFFAQVNLIFLRALRRFNCDTNFVVMVSFVNENVHSFNNIHNGRVKTRFQIVEF